MGGGQTGSGEAGSSLAGSADNAEVSKEAVLKSQSQTWEATKPGVRVGDLGSCRHCLGGSAFVFTWKDKICAAVEKFPTVPWFFTIFFLLCKFRTLLQLNSILFD